MGETVKRHFLQPFLLPLTDQRCRLGILTLLRHVFDKKLVCDHILSRIQQNTFRRKAVPACSSGLLIIAFHVFRHIIMDDVPHIRVSNHQFNWWFIISPPKGYCYCSPQRAVSQALLLARYKAVLLESSRLDSSACSFIYF